jgi:hypothetical protein
MEIHVSFQNTAPQAELMKILLSQDWYQFMITVSMPDNGTKDHRWETCIHPSPSDILSQADMEQAAEHSSLSPQGVAQESRQCWIKLSRDRGLGPR